nr:hypothetical protein [uncultured Caldimonas sp.]
MSTIQPATLAGSAATPAARLNSFGGLFWAALTGNLFATALLMSQNYAQVGQQDRARKALTYAGLAMLVILVLVVVLPEEVPVIAFSAPQLAVAYYLAKSHHDELVIPHLAKGGAVHSNWRGAGIGLLIGIVTFAVMLPFLLMLA